MNNMTDTRTFDLTTYDNVRASVGTRESLTFSDLVERLTSAPLVNTGDKTTGKAFAPGHYKHDQRSKNDFEGASLLCLDFDGTNHKALEPVQLLDIIQHFENLPYAYITYTTWARGLRVVLPLAENVSSAEYTELHDQIAAGCPVKPDRTGRTAERLHFYPQVPSEEARALHETGFSLPPRPFLSLSALRPSPTASVPASTGIFAGLKLSTVKVGPTGPSVTTLEDLTRELALSESKQEDLNKYVFALARAAAIAKQDPEQFAKALWPAAEAGLAANARPVEDWNLAIRTCERATEQAYAKVEIEQAAALAAIPKGAIKRAAEDVKNGNWTDAGKKLGVFAQGALSVAAIVQSLKDDIENSPACSNVPYALEQFEAGANDVTPEAWASGLKFAPDGSYADCDANVDHVLMHHPEVAGRLYRNVRSVLPRWYAADMPWGTKAGPVENIIADDSAFFRWIISDYVLNTGYMSATRAELRLRSAFGSAPEVDPFQKYLDGLSWDSQPRLDTWLIRHYGAADDEYTRLVASKWLIAACARTDDPGCQVDNMLVLVSPKQGLGKSSLAWSLLPEPAEWSGTIPDIHEREAPLKMNRFVIAVLEEVDKHKGRKSAAEIKEFITGRMANTRTAHARYESKLPRRAVLMGNSNKHDFVLDETGARRYWTVEVTRELDQKALKDERDQLWAEAWYRYCSGEQWWLTTDQQERLAAPKQAEIVREEPSPESEALLETMNYLPEGMRCPLRTPPDSRGTKIPVKPEQMDGDRMMYVTLAQTAAILKLHGFRNDDRTARDALRRAGLKRNKNNNRWTLTGV